MEKVIDVTHDLRETIKYLKANNLIPSLRKIESPNLALFLVLIILEWGLIISGCVLFYYGSMALLPISVLILGTRQRALGNFLHDTAHRHISSNNNINDFIGEYLLALPLFEVFHEYRETHLKHHRFLGSTLHDPDYIDKHKFIYISPQDKFCLIKIFLRLFFKPWKLQWKPKWKVIAWWAVLASGLTQLFSIETTVQFLCLWGLARLTVYRAIVTFTELSDHTFIDTHTNFKYTRNIPKSLLSFILYPYNDNFHLTHHLLPKVPTPRLKKAHQLLQSMEDYQKAGNYTGFFTGSGCLVSSWRNMLPPETLIVKIKMYNTDLPGSPG